MPEETYPVTLLPMIERAGSLTADEIDKLGQLWLNDEAEVLAKPSFAAELVGEVDWPAPTNQELIDAWEHALDAAGKAGRVEVIEAAEAAGHAARHDDRFKHDSEGSKNGTEEAVRSAVLAVGVRDLISDEDYKTLVMPWETVLGAI